MLGDLYVRAAGASSFEHRTGPHLRCLGQRRGASRIYACGDMIRDGFSVGFSDDRGTTFEKVMEFTELKGPLTCSEVQTACAAHWERIQLVLGIADGGTTLDAGTGPSDGGQPSPGGGTGSCTTIEGRSAGATWVLVLWLALARRGRRPGNRSA